jgi:hypothetical protein
MRVPLGPPRLPRARRGARAAALVLVLALPLSPAGCSTDTSRLNATQEQELESEGVLHRARNIVFRHTQNAGRAGGRWRDLVASIVVTKETVLIHRNERTLLRITPRTRRVVKVARSGSRIRIQIAGARGTETWSFIAPDDPAGWAEEVRAVVNRIGAGATGGGSA